ncbi:hypothetical protein [Nostoc sp. LPT]|uniref:hypothetical protein n=1 Tax=Nostoc sp. LPT TaxID=2815387 RepID=UPI0025CC5A16|nr:hypothetical protein [Nostoc sp. LPT]
MSKCRRGDRLVHGDKELQEKLGNNDLCLCGSGRCFQKVLSHSSADMMAAYAATTFRE